MSSYPRYYLEFISTLYIQYFKCALTLEGLIRDCREAVVLKKAKRERKRCGFDVKNI